MIDNRFVQMMARYNGWQNRAAYAAADTLTDAERRLDRGAFFTSIHATLSHLLWADRIWLSRFDRCPWYSGAAGRNVSAPLGIVLPHIFNHQTHHRGQVHAMLTAAGCRTEDTDLFLMPPADWLGFDPRS